MLRRLAPVLALAAGGLLYFAARASADAPASAPVEAGAALSSEEQLALAIDQMSAGKRDDALKSLESLTRTEPDYKLGKLIYGELQSTLAEQAAATTTAAPAAEGGDAELQALAEEARVRLASEQAVPPKDTLPQNIIALSPLFKNAVVVDLPRSRMYVFENKDGVISLARHHYIGIGKNGYGKQTKGDHRTPVGVYHITGWLPESELPQLYGAGAFPLSYPNPWDTYMKRSGAGIWLHGVPRNVTTRPPRSSEGCVTMANDDLLSLRPYVTLGLTPVVLSDDVKWVTPQQAQDDREGWLRRIETWRKRWSDRDTEAYLSDYSPDFYADGMGYAAFAAHKQRVNSTKKFISVALRDINLFHYPNGDAPMVLAEFSQDYQSDNYMTVTRKQQYWRQDKDGNWKIIREYNR